MLKTIRFAAYALIVLLGLVWAGVWWRGADLGLENIGVSLPGGVSVGGPFELVDARGAAVTDTTFRGRWMLIYFGYTFCPDVCPTELQTMAAALERLGPLAERVAPLFITIDPQRDTPTAVGEYVKLFDERIVGLSGSPERIAAAAKAYRVYFARARSKDTTDYLMDHSSFIYLVGPDGGFRALFRQGVAPQELADAIRSRMSAGG